MCKHRRADFRGSSRTTHKVYCLDCRTYIYECPQEAYKEEKKRERESNLRGRTSRFDLGARDVVLSRGEVLELAQMLPGHLKLMLRSEPEKMHLTCVRLRP